MTILFFIFAAVFIFLPYLPSLLEIRKQTDAAALKITTHILKDPRTEPELIFWHSAQILNLIGLEKLKKFVQVTEPKQIHNDMLALPGGLTPKPPKGTTRILSASDIQLTDRTAYASKILSFGSITTGTESVLNEIHSAEDLILKPKTKVFWWASGNQVFVENAARIPGKTQAKKRIQIREGAFFHLLEAPLIESSKPVSLKEPTRPLPKSFRNHSKLIRSDSDYRTKSGEAIEATLIVRGNLLISKNTVVQGDVKCRGKIILEEGAQVLGNLISETEIEMLGNNFVSGSVLAKRSITTASNCQIGTPEHQITFSGESILLKGAFEINGLARAWKTGQIIAG